MKVIDADGHIIEPEGMFDHLSDEFHLRHPNEASPLFRTAEAGVEWAVAQKFVALHGGELAERTDVPGEKELFLFLPLCR